jgi:hypothetical protein
VSNEFQDDPQLQGSPPFSLICKKFHGNAYTKPLIMTYEGVRARWNRFNGIYAMEQPRLDNRHRDRNGEIARKRDWAIRGRTRFGASQLSQVVSWLQLTSKINP